MVRRADRQRFGLAAGIVFLLSLFVYGIGCIQDRDSGFLLPPIPILFSSPSTAEKSARAPDDLVFVTRVIDGDTIELEDGRRVRYIGIDTPEIGDAGRSCYGKEAAEENRRLVEGRTVRLKRDVSDTDRYGRLLRYVYAEGVFVNEALVRGGFAVVSTYPPDVAHSQDLLAAQVDARTRGVGVWSSCVGD